MVPLWAQKWRFPQLICLFLSNRGYFILSWSNEEESAQITRMVEMHNRCLLPVGAKKRRNRPPNSCNGRHPGITLTANIWRRCILSRYYDTTHIKAIETFQYTLFTSCHGWRIYQKRSPQTSLRKQSCWKNPHRSCFYRLDNRKNTPGEKQRATNQLAFCYTM